MGNGHISSAALFPECGMGNTRGVSARAGATLASSRACLSPSTSCSRHRRLPALIITRKASSAISIYRAGRAVLEIPRFDAGTRGLIE